MPLCSGLIDCKVGAARVLPYTAIVPMLIHPEDSWFSGTDYCRGRPPRYRATFPSGFLSERGFCFNFPLFPAKEELFYFRNLQQQVPQRATVLTDPQATRASLQHFIPLTWLEKWTIILRIYPSAFTLKEQRCP